MRIYKQKINIESKMQIEFMDITDQIQDVVDKSGIREGVVLVYAPHTTMGMVINHNEPMLLQDMMRMVHKIAPVDERYSHDLFELRKGNKSDGRSNGHSHCKSIFLGVSEMVPMEGGKLTLTSRQSVFAVELDGSRKRDILVQVMGI